MVITRREVLAITNILGKIPQTVLNDPDPASTSNFTFSVIEDPPVSPSKGPTREPSARIDDCDLKSQRLNQVVRMRLSPVVSVAGPNTLCGPT